MTSHGSTSGVVAVGRQPKRVQEHLCRYNGLALGVDRPMLNMRENLHSLPLSSFYRSYIPILSFPEATVIALQDRTVSDTHEASYCGHVATSFPVSHQRDTDCPKTPITPKKRRKFPYRGGCSISGLS